MRSAVGRGPQTELVTATSQSARQSPVEAQAARDHQPPQMRLRRPLAASSLYSPTHYAPSGVVPGPQFGDPKCQEGRGASAVIAQAWPLAADCGTASPCGGRLYGGPARGPTFNWWRTRRAWLDNSAEEMERQADTKFERLLSPEEVARACGLSRRAVYRAIARGELLAARLCNRLRIRPAELEKWIETGTSAPETAVRPEARVQRTGTDRGLRALLNEEGRISR
jgi:excisionase family DNA binding protein